MRKERQVVKYDYRTNEIIGRYKSITEAAEENENEHPSMVYLMCARKNGIKSPRRPYYFRFEGDPPEPHTIIGCYDEDFNLIDTYYSKTECMNKTGLGWTAVCGQLKHSDKKLVDRWPTRSGLYLKYIEVK